MMATVPYFTVIPNKCTVVGICNIRNTFPQALPVDKTCDKKWEAGCALWMCYRSCQRRGTVNLVIILHDQGNVDNPRTDCCIWNNVHSNREQCSKSKRRLFSPEKRFTIKVETSEMLHLEHSFEWHWSLDTSGSTWGKYLGGFEMWCWRKLETIS